MLNEAAFCLYEGVGDAEAIDTVMRLGMNHPLGPLGAGRPDRPRHVPGDPRGAARRVRRSQVPALSAVAPVRRGGATRSQGRAWLPRIRLAGAGSSERSRRWRCGARRSRSSSTSWTQGWRRRTWRSGATWWPLPGFAFLLWRAGGLPGLRRGEALRILVAAFGGVTVYHLALNAGERTTASGVAALIVALAPAATLALALAVGLESYAPRRLGGHRAGVRGRRRRRRARLGRELLAGRAARARCSCCSRRSRSPSTTSSTSRSSPATTCWR